MIMKRLRIDRMSDDILRRDVELAFRLAVSGASRQTIANALGITAREMKQLETLNPALETAINQGRAKGIEEVTANLFRIASTTADVNAIKYYLGIQSPEYRIDKASVEITNDNRTVSIPTLEEARAIIMNDPAMLPPTNESDEAAEHTAAVPAN